MIETFPNTLINCNLNIITVENDKYTLSVRAKINCAIGFLVFCVFLLSSATVWKIVLVSIEIMNRSIIGIVYVYSLLLLNANLGASIPFPIRIRKIIGSFVILLVYTFDDEIVFVLYSRSTVFSKRTRAS